MADKAVWMPRFLTKSVRTREPASHHCASLAKTADDGCLARSEARQAETVGLTVAFLQLTSIQHRGRALCTGLAGFMGLDAVDGQAKVWGSATAGFGYASTARNADTAFQQSQAEIDLGRLRTDL